jgi:hypothetical protein
MRVRRLSWPPDPRRAVANMLWSRGRKDRRGGLVVPQ